MFKVIVKSLPYFFLPIRVTKLCHSDGTRPHQVRVLRVFGLLSARLGKHSGKAYLMRPGFVKMTKFEI